MHPRPVKAGFRSWTHRHRCAVRILAMALTMLPPPYPPPHAGEGREAGTAKQALVLDINVLGTFRFTKAAVPALAAANCSAIVNLSSVAGTAGSPLLTAYSASKGAVIRFTESAAVELRPAGIRVNAVCPGLIHTEMAERLVAPLEAVMPITFDELISLKQGRYGTPEEVAETVAFLASDEARFVTGSHYLVDGGMTASLF